ncbi:MAG: MFS transporter [Deltaproteobacteria bacterium]|nr:MFS transporter [Deltaproteobacteria bacterium]
MARTSLSLFFYRMVLPYMSVYTRALGATGTELGIVNSVGMATGGLVGPFTGWMIDKIGVKKIYLVGILILAMSYLVYGAAQGWRIIIVAMIAYWVGFGVSGHTCAVICGNSLASEDRATAMSLCETFAAGILGITAPMIGAWLVTVFGGVNVSGIRPLFFVSFAGVVATFFLILTRLSNSRWTAEGETGSGFLKDFSEVFKKGHNLKKWLVISSVSDLPWFMVVPFTQPFAHEIKGADQYILGAMVTGFAVIPLIVGIPAGRLADRIGRKKVIYLMIPFIWASSLLLIYAPNSLLLVTAGVLQGFMYTNSVITGAMTFELVPAERMGRWLGIVRLCRLLLGAGGVYLGGVIWDVLGPQFVFLSVIVLDVLVRIPLLAGMPETLGLKVK